MILFKRTPFQCKMKNVMMLDVDLKRSVDENDVDDESVVYVSKNTYDQCVRLHGRFEGEIGYMCRNFGVEYGDGTVVDFFYNNAPEPLNILAPFLGELVKAGHKIEADDIETMLGYLHIMSQIINFDSYTLMPVDARADVTVGNAVLKSYKESWEDLTESLMDRIPPALQPVGAYIGAPQIVNQQMFMQPAETKPVQADLHDAAVLEDDFESEDDFVAMMDALLEQATAEAEEETKTPEAKVPETPVSTASSDVEKREEVYKEENDKIADAMAKYIGH